MVSKQLKFIQSLICMKHLYCWPQEAQGYHFWYVFQLVRVFQRNITNKMHVYIYYISIYLCLPIYLSIYPPIY